VGQGRLGRAAVEHQDVLLIAVGVAVGLAAHVPLRWLGDHQAINVLLAVLTFSSALLVPADALAQLRAGWRQLALGLAAGATLLPAIAWGVSFLVPAGVTRHGLLGLGVAPCEIASVATVGVAGGDIAVAAAMLLGSTLVSVVVAGPVLALEAGHSSVHPVRIIVNLLLVVVLPLGVGWTLRRRVQATPRVASLPQPASMASLTVLVALVSAQVTLSLAYVRVAAAIVVFVAATAALGWALAVRATRPQRAALVLTVSMRDFAIAAGLVSSAFGPAAAAPLAVYGVVALMWGLLAAGRLAAPTPVALSSSGPSG
jgi:BASS family bile acid:Na+ symporter